MVNSIIHAFNAFSDLAVAIIAFFCFFTWYFKRKYCNIGKVIGLSGFLYLCLSFVSFMWLFGFLKDIPLESFAMRSIFLVLNTFIISLVLYELTRNKRILYLLLLYIISLSTSHYTVGDFLFFISGLSILLTLLMFLDLAIFSNFQLKTAGIIGIVYSYLYLFSIIQVKLGIPANSVAWFVPDLVIFLVYVFFYMDIKLCGIVKLKAMKKRKANYPLLFLKYIIYVITICAFILLSAISIHEIGHAFTAQMYSCEYTQAVIYEVFNMPHTEIRCSRPYNLQVMLLSGLAATIIISLLFLFTEDRLLRKMAYIIAGMGFLLSYGDLYISGVPVSIIAVLMFSSVFVLLWGIIQLTTGYLGSKELLCAAKDKKKGLRNEKNKSKGI